MSDYGKYNQNYRQNYPHANINNSQNHLNRLNPLNSGSSSIHFISQPSIHPIYPNGSQHQSLLGSALIPVMNTGKQISASEKNLQIINEVKREKEGLDPTNDINEKYKSKAVKKCDLHPIKLSDKCRKCKEIRNSLEEADTSPKETTRDITNATDNNQNYNEKITGEETVINTEYKIWGDPITCNINPLILNNILSSQYFKEVCAFKNYYEIIQEIVDNVTYAEAWAVGISGIPSTLFCCLYRLMLSKLSESQVQFLEEHSNPFVRCAGFLYVRYLTDPKDLWQRLSPFLADDQAFIPNADKKTVVKIGEYVESLLTDYNYYGTRLARIPTGSERGIKANLIARLQETNNYHEEGELVKRNSRSGSRSRKRDRKKRHEDRRHRRRRSASSSSRGSYRSRSRSHSKKNKNDIIQKIKEQERQSALAVGRDYAQKPTSYKSSLSLKLPGNVRKRSKSRSPLKQNVRFVERKESRSAKQVSKPEIEYSKEFLVKQEMLKKQYGSKSFSKSTSNTAKKPTDEDNEFMHLG